MPRHRKGSVKLQAAAAANPCESLTPAAIQAVIDQINKCLASARADEALNGDKDYTPRYCRMYVDEALNGMNILQSWLAANELDKPFVSNPSAAASVNGYAYLAIVNLHPARYWTMLSAIYHASLEALNCYNLITQALSLLESLGTQGGLCYLHSYLP